MPDPVLETLKVSSLKSHPANPRLIIREDVVDGIATQLKVAGEFSQMYAPIVRKINGHYEVVAGHHRTEAAKRAGLKSIPCWVSEMDDEAAYMLLVLSNAQGELGPLEIGVHALHYVPPEKGGRGKKGGLSEYAKKIGRNQQYVVELRQAAEVYEAVKPTAQAVGLLDKAKHLAAIHGVDPLAITGGLFSDVEDVEQRNKQIAAIRASLWAVCVKWMLERKWSADDTDHWIKKVREFRIPEHWRTTFLPLCDVVDRMLDTKEFAPGTVTRLCAAADRVMETINATRTNDESDGLTNPKSDALAIEFIAWLHDNTGADSWDERKIVEYHHALEARLQDEADKLQERWCLGDWRDHVGKLADESVALVLTDPPYGQGFQSDYRLDRRVEKKHKKIENDDEASATREIMDALAALLPKLRSDAHVFCFCPGDVEGAHLIVEALRAAGLTYRDTVVWDKVATGMGDPKTTVAPQHELIIHAVKGSPMLYERISSVLRYQRVNSKRHPTEKPVEMLVELIGASTAKGEVVVDPFGGSASTLVAGKQCGREFWGCEVSEEYHKAGKDRLQ